MAIIHLRFFLICILAVCINPHLSHAQLWNVSSDLDGIREGRLGLLRTGFGWTRIAVNDTGEAVNYATITLYPEFSVGKLHAGLAIDLLVNTADDPGGSKIKQADLKAGHLFRYIRYGNISDPSYLQVGALERVTLGNGFLVSRYSNQIDDQSRRTGLWFKLDRGRGGIEGFLSNIGTREIYGGRAFMRPAGGMFRKLTFGVTIVIDDDPSRGKTRLPARSAEVVGLDISYPFIENSIFSVTGYGDIAKFLDSGSGAVTGVRLQIPKIGGLLSLTGRLEQHFLGDGFVPAFFDETYEVTSIQADGRSRLSQLRSLPDSRGTLGAIDGVILNRLRLFASYRTFYARNDMGIFHGEVHLIHTIPRLTLRAVYDKQGVGSLSDLRKLDNRSIALAEATYRLYPFLLIGFDYRWTYAFDENPDIHTFRPLERFSPRIMFEVAF